MPLDPKVNAENPPKPGQQVTAPSGTGGFHVPSANPQPMIDPINGKIITSEGPQNVNPAVPQQPKQ
jgi:hypothetical protein